MAHSAFVKGALARLGPFQNRKDDTGSHTAQYTPSISVRSWQTVGRASEDGKVQPGHAEQDRLISGLKDCPGERGFF